MCQPVNWEIRKLKDHGVRQCLRLTLLAKQQNPDNPLILKILVLTPISNFLQGSLTLR